MYAKKKALNKTANYAITLSKNNFDSTHQDCIGKLRYFFSVMFNHNNRSTSLAGREYKIYSSGLSSKKTTNQSK